jgi:hypothetical protein
VTINHYLLKTCFLAALGAARLIAQTSGGVPPAPASSGTYSIEAEILAYKSLATNSDTISVEVAGLLGSPQAKLHLACVDRLLPSGWHGTGS